MNYSLSNSIVNGFIITIIIASFFGCNSSVEQKSKQYFKDVEWFYGDEIVFRNGYSISFTKYDAEKKIFYKDSAFPISLNDTGIVYTRYRKQGVYNDNAEFEVTNCEKLVDTIRFDFKYINKQAKLILYLEPFPLILSTNKPLRLKETSNYSPIKFVISYYSIGDQIDRSFLKTRGIYNYPNYTIEDCELIGNKDITFKIIGYNTIYAIERRSIENFRIEEIVKVVNSKLSLAAKYRPMRQWIDGADYEYEFYRWSENGVQINLSHSKYIGSQVYKTLVKSNDWVLSYDDSFLQAILVETYRNGKPHSSIIN